MSLVFSSLSVGTRSLEFSFQKNHLTFSEIDAKNLFQASCPDFKSVCSFVLSVSFDLSSIFD
ncbi:MAG: hypothetical protein ACOZBL_04115 [Patescibacteria group bacterium]